MKSIIAMNHSVKLAEFEVVALDGKERARNLNERAAALLQAGYLQPGWDKGCITLADVRKVVEQAETNKANDDDWRDEQATRESVRP